MPTRTIPLGARGQYKVKVDACDYAWLTQWRWSFMRFSWPYGGSIYARRYVRRGGRRIALYMHTEILIHRMRLRGRRSTRASTAHHTRQHAPQSRLGDQSEQSANQRRRISKAEKVAFAVAAAEVPS